MGISSLAFVNCPLTQRSARDTQQTELLMRRYFQKGDTYVHSDLENSCVAVIKSNDGETISPGALAQAGIMAVATSRAWDAKQGIVSSFLSS